MATEFTVIMRVRHRFGDQRGDRGFEGDVEQVYVDSEAPFVGAVGTFEFACPAVDSAQDAVLQFEHRGSDQWLAFPDSQPDGGLVGLVPPEHPVSINGHQIAGGVPASPTSRGTPAWGTRLLTIDPGVLKEQNELRIETGPLTVADMPQNLDDFTIDNVVVFYKTGRSTTPPIKSAG
jgi:hypothetical protein